MHPTAEADPTTAAATATARHRDRAATSTSTPCWPGAAPESPDAPLVGREADIAAIRRLATGRDRAFVTLAGIGGVGKSRLAVEVARRAMPRRDGRIAFVPLDGVSDASLVVPAIAGAMGVADEPGRTLVESLAEALGRAPSMLVLDTVEHVRSAAPALADLLARTPGLTILATSRIAIGVPRERVVWVEPLPVPPDDGARSRRAACATRRSRCSSPGPRVSRPEIEATPTNAALAAAICRRLDGIPLAIELAAAALRVLAPHQLVDQLEGRIAETGVEPAVDGGARRRRPRPRPPAQPAGRDGLEHRPAARAGPAAVPARLGDLGDVRRPRRRSRSSRAASDAGSRRSASTSSPGSQQLAAASLLRHEDEGRAYAMLTTVRADAQDRLARSGEDVAMRWAHAYEVLAVAEEAEQALPTGRDLEALDRLDEAHDDIREALEWAMEQGDGTFALRLAGHARRVLADPRPPHRGPAPAGGGPVDGGGPAAGRTAARRSAARGCWPRTRATTGSGEAYLREALARRARGRRRGGDGGQPQLARDQRLRQRRPRRRRGVRSPRASRSGAGSGIRRGSRWRSTRWAASTTSAGTSTAPGRCSSRASRSRRGWATRTGSRSR